MRDSTIEDRLREHLNNKAASADNTVVSAFYLWQGKVLKPVEIEPTDRILEAEEFLGDAGRSFELNRCYENAAQVAISSAARESNISYVEGFVVINDHLFGHAWNSVGERHFDLTTTLADSKISERGFSTPTRHFFKVVELSPEKVFPLTLLSDGEASLKVSYFSAYAGVNLTDLAGMSLATTKEPLP